MHARNTRTPTTPTPSRGRAPLRRPFDDARERRQRDDSPALPLTVHARTRMHSRSFSRWDVEAVVDYGREVWQRGSLTYVVGRREVAAARRDGIDLRHVEGIHVVCSCESLAVLTAYRNRSRLQLAA